MIDIVLQRNNNGSDNSLLGQLFDEGQQVAVTIENKELSIPAGTYECIPHNSVLHPDTWEISSVPGRTAILIHSANLAIQLLGCVAPGNTYGKLQGEDAVLNSALTMKNLKAKYPDYFTLTIKDAI